MAAWAGAGNKKEVRSKRLEVRKIRSKKLKIRNKISLVGLPVFKKAPATYR